MKIILLILMTLALANCTKTMTGKSSANATYKVKEEGTNDAILNKVPQWFVDAQIEKGLITNRDAENYIYGVGSGESPDLQMAIDKAILVAKAVFPMDGLPAIIIKSCLCKPPSLSSKSLNPVGTPTMPSSFL